MGNLGLPERRPSAWGLSVYMYAGNSGREGLFETVTR